MQIHNIAETVAESGKKLVFFTEITACLYVFIGEYETLIQAEYRDDLSVVNDGTGIREPAFDHVTDQMDIQYFRTAGGLNDHTVQIPAESISCEFHVHGTAHARCYFLIQQIPQKILIVEPLCIMNKGIPAHLLIDVFFQKQQKFRINIIEGTVYGRNDDMPHILLGIDRDIHLLIAQYFVISAYRDLAFQYPAVDIGLSACHFIVGICETFIQNNGILYSQIFDRIPGRRDQIIVRVEDKDRVPEYLVRVFYGCLKAVLKSEEFQQRLTVHADAALFVEVLLNPGIHNIRVV